MGHTVRLIPPQHCTPFLRMGKSDARAAQRPARALEDGENELTPVAREMLHELYEELLQTIARNQALLARLVEQARTQPAYERLQTMPGISPVLASALLAAIGDGHQFRNGRQMAPGLGWYRDSTAPVAGSLCSGSARTGTVTCGCSLSMGPGPRCAGPGARGKDTPLGAWISLVVTRRGVNKAVVALANKIARISCNVVAKGCTYEPSKAFGRS